MKSWEALEFLMLAQAVVSASRSSALRDVLVMGDISVAEDAVV
jgi:hypothetical protein